MDVAGIIGLFCFLLYTFLNIEALRIGTYLLLACTSRAARLGLTIGRMMSFRPKSADFNANTVSVRVSPMVLKQLKYVSFPMKRKEKRRLAYITPKV
jgi:hypothetical protein